MTTHIRSRKPKPGVLLLELCMLLSFAVQGSALAQAQYGGTVMPPRAMPRGYSLDAMAKACLA
jgi:hypothetical protein